MMKGKKSFWSKSVLLFAAAGVLLFMSTVGSTRAALTYYSENYAAALSYAEELRKDYRVSIIARPKKLGKFLNKLEQQGFNGFAVYGQEDGVKLFS